MNFKGYQFPKEVILETVRYYLAYKLSYRDIEEINAERGIRVDHSNINRWVLTFGPLIEQAARGNKRSVATSWRMDETYVRVKGKWMYYYRAVDKFGDVIDYYLSEHRDEKSAKAFLNKAIAQNGLPEKVVIDACTS